jgi:hypothetical protein
VKTSNLTQKFQFYFCVKISIYLVCELVPKFEFIFYPFAVAYFITGSLPTTSVYLISTCLILVVLHFMNADLVEISGRRWVCDDARDVGVQATVAWISPTILTRPAVSLHSGSSVEKHLPHRSKLPDLWPGWLHVWWPCYYRWSYTLWQFERITNFPLQPSEVVDPIQVKKNITDSQRKLQIASYPCFWRKKEFISFKAMVLRTKFFRAVALFGLWNSFLYRCDDIGWRSDEA